MNRHLTILTMKTCYLFSQISSRQGREAQVIRRIILRDGVIGLAEKTGITLQGTIGHQFDRPKVDAVAARQSQCTGPAQGFRFSIGPETQTQGNDPQPQRRFQRPQARRIRQPILGKGNATGQVLV